MWHNVSERATLTFVNAKLCRPCYNKYIQLTDADECHGTKGRDDWDDEMRFLFGLSCAAAAAGEGDTAKSHYSNDKCTKCFFFLFYMGWFTTCAPVDLVF